jgi:hypothetical protein
VHEWFHDPAGNWVTRSYTVAYSADLPIAYWPETGEYKVTYISVATDGEPVRGEFTFTYSGAVQPLPADFRPQKSEPDPNLLSAAATDAPTGPPSGLPISEQVKAEEAGPGLWILWVPVIIALVAAVAIYLFWRMRPQQVRALMVSRFGGRYAAPVQRPPLRLPAGITDRIPASIGNRLPIKPRPANGDASNGSPSTDEPGNADDSGATD